MALALMRRHRRWLFVFLWLVIAAFIILYIPAFQDVDAGSPGEAIALVGEEPVTAGEFRTAYLRQRQMYERLYQGRLDAAALRNLGLEEQTLEGLIDQKLVVLEAKRLGLVVDDDALARRLATAPEFQRDGKFVGAAEIRRLLDMQGMTVSQFEEDLRRDMLREKLQSLVTAGLVLGPDEAEQEFRRRTEQVKAEYVLVDSARFAAETAATDAEIEARYKAQQESYRIPERRVVSYVLVDPEAAKGRVAVTDGDIEQYYRDHEGEFREEEQACASHILVKVKATPEATEGHPDAEARTLAEAALAEVQKGGDFAAVARRVSEDKGSGPGGGDLGCFPRGRMVPEFDAAAFALDPGQTSELVKTSFGYHVIRLNSRKDSATSPLSAVKDRIRQILVADRSRAQTEERVQAVSAALARGRSLEEAAREQGLAVAKSAPFDRSAGADDLRTPTLAARVFEMQVGQTDPSPLRSVRGMAFVRLDEVQAARVPPLSEVKEKVRAGVVEEKAMARARTLADELRAAAEKDGLETAATAKGLVRKETPGLVGRQQPLGELGSTAELEATVYGAAPGTLLGPVRASGGYALVRVLESKPFDPVAFAQQKASIENDLRQQKQAQLFRAYMTQARQRFTVERRTEALRRVAG